MLSIFLAEEFEQMAKNSPDVVFLEYFCDDKDEKRRTADGIVRGLLFQLLQLRPNLFPHILPTFDIQKESLFSASSIESLWRIFKTILYDSWLGIMYCVIDGLDECDEASLEVFLGHLKVVFLRNSGDTLTNRLKFIIASRDLPEIIPELLSSFPRIRLDLDAQNQVNQDVNRFINVELDGLASYRQYPAPLYTKVKRVFQDRGQGTFLWVGIVAKTIRRYKATEVEAALNLFPPGLEAIYARMLLQIDDDRCEIAAKILRWVVLAARPLTLSELSAAIEPLGEPTDGFSRDHIIKDQISHCGYFLIIRKHKVNIIHQSAKEYLLRKERDPNPKLEFFRVEAKVGNGEIARRCFYELQSGPFIYEQPNDRASIPIYIEEVTSYLEASPLRSYAVLFWPIHANSLSSLHDIFDLSLPFYHTNSRVRFSWLEAYDHIRPFHGIYMISQPLHLAAWAGIVPLAEKLLTQKGLMYWMTSFPSINQEDHAGLTALELAARNGHLAMVELLLEKGAEIGTINGWNKKALIGSAARGHGAIVQLLLEKGEDIEIKNVDGSTALIVASGGGHRDVVQLLLDRGANIEARNFVEKTALIEASEQGHRSLVELLLEKRADIEAGDTVKRTALIKASEQGHRDVVRTLLDNGANSEAQNRLGERALIAACSNGHRGVVQLLLEKGAEIQSGNDIALIEASRQGHRDIVELLLENGADIEAQGRSGDRALTVACRNGFRDVVRLLLRKGAGIYDEDGMDISARLVDFIKR